MKKKAILGVAGVLSLVMGTTVFASDFSNGYMGRMPLHNFKACSYVDVSRNYMRPASGICLADRCDFGNCNFIDGNWVGSCGNYVDEDQNGVCDNYTGQGNGAGSGAGYGGGSGAANNYTEPVYTEPVYNEPVYTEPVYNEPVYNDTGNYGNQGYCGGGYNGQGYGGCGYGGGYGGGHHGGGHGCRR